MVLKRYKPIEGEARSEMKENKWHCGVSHRDTCGDERQRVVEQLLWWTVKKQWADRKSYL